MRAFLILALSLLVNTIVSAQAELTIENNSQRNMTVKVMKGKSSANSSVHEVVTISPYGRSTIYFTESEYYFTKTKAVLGKKEPIYQKGQPFHVVNDETGYSVMTLTFSITESNVPQVSGGIQISKTEFDKN